MEFFILEERAVADSPADSYGFLGDDSAGADILMSYFTVAHCSVRKAHVFAAGVDKTVWILCHQHIIYRRISTLDGVIFIFIAVWVVTPSVAND